MVTEIGARNFGDVTRYNLLRHVASRMGLDTQSDRTLWKDRALVELNAAVLHSFAMDGVTMVDHHTASRQFVRHALGCSRWPALPSHPHCCNALVPSWHRLQPNLRVDACDHAR